MEDVLYFLLIPQFCISLTTWAQIVLSINRFNGCLGFQRTDLWGLLLLMQAAFLRWIATLAIATTSFAFQFTASVTASTLGWASFVIIFNEDFVLPTRQQTWSLLMSLFVTILWEMNNRFFYAMTTKS